MEFIKVILFVIFSQTVMAGEGLVIVLDAPILSEPDLESQIEQFVRKGQKVFIHAKHFWGSPDSPVYMKRGDRRRLNLPVREDKGFYETKTRTGNIGYIPKAYVKLMYLDRREFSENISPFKHDPTDYRLDEPIPDGYPLVETEKVRAMFSFGTGPDFKTNYNYGQFIETEEFSNRYEMNLLYMWKADFDKFDRFYFTLNFHFQTAQADFQMFDEQKTTEIRTQFGLGPGLSYDVFRNEDWVLTSAGALSLNQNKFTVSQTDTNDDFEERIFKGLSMTPKFYTYATKKNFIGPTHLSFGMSYQLFLPHSLKSSTPIEIPELWQDVASNDRIDIPLGGILTFFVGVMGTY